MIYFALLLIVTLVLYLLSKVPRFKAYVEKKLETIRRKFLWSGVIQAITISYLDWCVYLAVFIEVYKPIWQWYHVAFCILLNYWLLFFPLYAVYFTKANSKYMMGRTGSKIYAPLVSMISFKRSGNTSYYFSLFICRRYLLIVIPLVLSNFAGLQIQAIMIVQIIYSVAYGVFLNLPHEESSKRS